MGEESGIHFGFTAAPVDAEGASDDALYGEVVADCALGRALGYGSAWLLEHPLHRLFPHAEPHAPHGLPGRAVPRPLARHLRAGDALVPSHPLRRGSGHAERLERPAAPPRPRARHGEARIRSLGGGSGGGARAFRRMHRPHPPRAYGRALPLRGQAFPDGPRGAHPAQAPWRAHQLLWRHRQPGQRRGHGRARPSAHGGRQLPAPRPGAHPGQLGRRHARVRPAHGGHETDHDPGLDRGHGRGGPGARETVGAALLRPPGPGTTRPTRRPTTTSAPTSSSRSSSAT